MHVAGVRDLAELTTAMWGAFNHVLKDARPEQMLLLSEGAKREADKGCAPVWQRVTAQSDLALVLERGSLKLIERHEEHSDTAHGIAFPLTGLSVSESLPPPNSRGRKSKHKALGGTASHTNGASHGERFADEDGLQEEDAYTDAAIGGALNAVSCFADDQSNSGGAEQRPRLPSDRCVVSTLQN